MSHPHTETSQPHVTFEPKERPDPESGKTSTEGQSIGGEGQTSDEEYPDKTGAESGSGEATKAPRPN